MWRLGASCPAPLVRRPRDARVSIDRRQEASGAVCEQEARGGVSRPRRRCEPRGTAVERADAHEDKGDQLVRDEARRLRQPRPAASAPEERDESELRRHGEATGDAGNGKGRAPGGDWQCQASDGNLRPSHMQADQGSLRRWQQWQQHSTGWSAEIFKLWGDNRPPLWHVQSKLLSYHALQNEATYPLDRVEVRLQDGNVLIRSLACVHAVALIPAHSLALAIHPLVRPASVR